MEQSASNRAVKISYLYYKRFEIGMGDLKSKPIWFTVKPEIGKLLCKEKFISISPMLIVTDSLS